MSAVIRSSAASLLTIISDILDFSKIEAGKLEIDHIEFSLADVVENAGELIYPRAEEKGIELAVVVDPEAPESVSGDPTRIRQILINLIGNGVKFTEAGSVIVRVGPAKAGMVRFEVADTGIGLSRDQQGRLFKAFEQADVSTQRRYGGTGLGLSISRQLCGLMNGRIGVLSEPGKGSTFWFELPLAPIEMRRAHDERIAGIHVTAVGFRGGAAEALDAFLADAEIPDCMKVPYGADIMARVKGGTGIVLLSAQDGLTRALAVSEEIRRQAPGRPVILVGGRDLGTSLNRSGQNGFRTVVSLPLRRGRLRQAMAVALGHAGPSEPNEVGPQKFDPPEFPAARAAGVLILVAEDNATNRAVIRRQLNNLGYIADMATDGQEALEKYQPGVHGLLLTDCHMPGMDGFALTVEIRRREVDTHQRLPIIALTADAVPGTEQRCLQVGMDGYLIKPVEFKLLAASLERWLPAATALRRPRVASSTKPGATQ